MSSIGCTHHSDSIYDTYECMATAPSVWPAGDDEPDEAAGPAERAVGNSMSDAEQAAFASAIADCENATVQFCASGKSSTYTPVAQ